MESIHFLTWSLEKAEVIIRGDQMFQTSSCDRKLPTHSKCHAEFWAGFLFPFPFSPLSNFFSSKSIQKLLPKLSSSIVVLMTSFPSPTPPCLSSHGQSLPLFPWTASMPACTSFPPYFWLLFISCYTGLPFLMSQCWGVYPSLLLTNRVFPFFHPRRPISLLNQFHLYIHCSRTYCTPSACQALFWAL